MKIILEFSSIEEMEEWRSAGKQHVEEVKPAPATEPEPEQEVDESFRVKVRKTLAELNKKTGTNTASTLIKSFGVEKLTEVTLKDLPALMEKAKEAMDAE